MAAILVIAFAFASWGILWWASAEARYQRQWERDRDEIARLVGERHQAELLDAAARVRRQRTIDALKAKVKVTS